MPEGDSYRRYAVRLRPLVGHRVEARSPSPRGAATGVASRVDGLVLEAASAAGKQLRLDFEGGLTLVSELRMTGRWFVLPAGADVRASAWLALSTPVATAVQVGGPILRVERTRQSARPDILGETADVAQLVGRLRRADQARPLAETLQDQRLVAGIGNLWATEALWTAGLHPSLATGAATDDELARLLRWARDAMTESVTGSRPPRAVYRRAGRPCPRCGATITTARVGDGARVSYRCDRCQRRV